MRVICDVIPVHEQLARSRVPANHSRSEETVMSSSEPASAQAGGGNGKFCGEYLNCLGK